MAPADFTSKKPLEGLPSSWKSSNQSPSTGEPQPSGTMPPGNLPLEGLPSSWKIFNQSPSTGKPQPSRTMPSGNLPLEGFTSSWQTSNQSPSTGKPKPSGTTPLSHSPSGNLPLRGESFGWQTSKQSPSTGTPQSLSLSRQQLNNDERSRTLKSEKKIARLEAELAAEKDKNDSLEVDFELQLQEKDISLQELQLALDNADQHGTANDSDQITKLEERVSDLQIFIGELQYNTEIQLHEKDDMIRDLQMALENADQASTASDVHETTRPETQMTELQDFNNALRKELQNVIVTGENHMSGQGKMTQRLGFAADKFRPVVKQAISRADQIKATATPADPARMEHAERFAHEAREMGSFLKAVILQVEDDNGSLTKLQNAVTHARQKFTTYLTEPQSEIQTGKIQPFSDIKITTAGAAPARGRPLGAAPTAKPQAAAHSPATIRPKAAGTPPTVGNPPTAASQAGTNPPAASKPQIGGVPQGITQSKGKGKQGSHNADLIQQREPASQACSKPIAGTESKDKGPAKDEEAFTAAKSKSALVNRGPNQGPLVVPAASTNRFAVLDGESLPTPKLALQTTGSTHHLGPSFRRPRDGGVETVLRGPSYRHIRDVRSETFPIESSLVGMVIGHGGDNVKRVQAETSTKVQFLAAHNGDKTMSRCKISGNHEARSNAVEAINRIIEANGKGPSTSGRAPPPPVRNPNVSGGMPGSSSISHEAEKQKDKADRASQHESSLDPFSALLRKKNQEKLDAARRTHTELEKLDQDLGSKKKRKRGDSEESDEPEQDEMKDLGEPSSGDQPGEGVPPPSAHQILPAKAHPASSRPQPPPGTVFRGKKDFEEEMMFTPDMEKTKKKKQKQGST